MIEQPEFQELKRELVELTGLAYYNKQEKLLAKRVGKRLASTQLELAQYRRLLLDSTVELANLIQEVTLGESYFLRYPDQTTALEQVLLPVLLERKRSRRELRIWSAGCSTGEEPYSLLFLLKDRFESQLAGWEVEILATDINELYLSRAEEAHFRDWSLRSVSEQTRERWFVPSGKGWQVRPRYRDWLRFERHNLVRDPFPTLEGGFDLILCRNVLMYLSLIHI